MSYSVFFSIEAIGRSVDSASPESCSGTDTIMDLLASLNSEGDFFGLIDEKENCLQVRFENEPNRYWVEMPRPDLGGSYGAYFAFEDAARIFKSLPKLFPDSGFPGFEFIAWR